MPPQLLLDVPITFDVGDQLTHAPMVHVTLHGISTKLILDTGSTDHILTIELAQQLGLEAKRGEAGTDSTGASVPSWTLGTVAAELAGHGFDLHEVVAITAPAPFPGWGIGGFISPQHLHPTAWAVLDLAAERFVLLDGDEADVTAWLTARKPTLELLNLERVPGARRSWFARRSSRTGPPSRCWTAAASAPSSHRPRSPTRETARGPAPGAASAGERPTARSLPRGHSSSGARLPVATLIVGPEMDGRDGLVGMDVLRGTVLTVSGDPDRPVLWQVASS